MLSKRNWKQGPGKSGASRHTESGAAARPTAESRETAGNREADTGGGKTDSIADGSLPGIVPGNGTGNGMTAGMGSGFVGGAARRFTAILVCAALLAAPVILTRRAGAVRVSAAGTLSAGRLEPGTLSAVDSVGTRADAETGAEKETGAGKQTGAEKQTENSTAVGGSAVPGNGAVPVLAVPRADWDTTNLTDTAPSVNDAIPASALWEFAVGGKRSSGGAAAEASSDEQQDKQQDKQQDRQQGAESDSQEKGQQKGQQNEQAEPPAGNPPAAPVLRLETYAGIPCEADTGAGLTVTVTKAPKHGTVETDGSRLAYIPEEGFTGVDRFTCTVTDSRGQVSKPGRVTVRVRKTAVPYEDMAGNSAALAAQELAAAGVFTGENIGGRYFFGPDEPLTRSEFLAMALETLGQEAPAVSVTAFSDDGQIPVWAKPYVSAAVSAGILRGVATEEGAVFRGGEPITWQQAAAMLDRALQLGDVDLDEWFGDRAEPDLWAAQAVGNLEASGILEAGSFGSLTMERALTRADAARILTSARTLMEERQEDGGLFAWLKAAVGQAG